jgi:hypothetical protein
MKSDPKIGVIKISPWDTVYLTVSINISQLPCKMKNKFEVALNTLYSVLEIKSFDKMIGLISFFSIFIKLANKLGVVHSYPTLYKSEKSRRFIPYTQS